MNIDNPKWSNDSVDKRKKDARDKEADNLLSVDTNAVTGQDTNIPIGTELTNILDARIKKAIRKEKNKPSRWRRIFLEPPVWLDAVYLGFLSLAFNIILTIYVCSKDEISLCADQYSRIPIFNSIYTILAVILVNIHKCYSTNSFVNTAMPLIVSILVSIHVFTIMPVINTFIAISINHLLAEQLYPIVYLSSLLFDLLLSSAINLNRCCFQKLRYKRSSGVSTAVFAIVLAGLNMMDILSFMSNYVVLFFCLFLGKLIILLINIFEMDISRTKKILYSLYMIITIMVTIIQYDFLGPKGKRGLVRHEVPTFGESVYNNMQTGLTGGSRQKMGV